MSTPQTETYTHFCCGGCGSEFPISEGIDETRPGVDPVPVYVCATCAANAEVDNA